MTDNGGNDRRREIEGRINTLGTGGNGVSDRRSRGADSHEGDDADSGVTPEADSDDHDDEEATERETGVTPEADGHGSEDAPERETEVTPEADTDDRESEEEDRSSLEVELDPFVRAFAARRAEESDETIDEYVVGSVKGYLAGLLGGDVESPGTLNRQVDVEADDILGGLLDAVADEGEDRGDVVVAAVTEAYDVPDEETLDVAGLRDHEALLNGVVANNSNSLNDVSEVVQAAVETRLIEERRE